MAVVAYYLVCSDTSSGVIGTCWAPWALFASLAHETDEFADY